MPKKIYDIKPPKVAHKVEKDLKEFLSEKKGHVQRQPERKPARRKKEGKSIWLPVSIGGVVVVLIIGIYLFFTLPKAQVVIWPKVDTLSYKETVTADKSADAVDDAKAIVPAQYFETSKTLSQDFPATGNASNEGKASGTITIYNKADPVTSLTLKTGTHFLSDSGKLFVASQKIIVPAGTKVGNKITPGSVQVNVQAVEGGDSYNVAPSNFSIPGFKGIALYYSVYASSSKPMAGGYAGKVKKVTDDDIQQAKNVLVEKATADAKTDLKNQISSDYILLDNAVSTSTTSASADTKSGTVADNFTYQVAVKASALAFKKSDLNKFATDYILSQMPDGKTLLDKSFKINYSASTVDVSGGKASVNLDFSAGAYGALDKNSISLSLLGKNEQQINETINNSIGDRVAKIKISFWPFWVKSAPTNQKAVNVELKFQ
jgi:hypothetical protein